METERPPTSREIFYTRTFALVTLAILGFLLYLILLPFFVPLTWALFLAFLLNPLHQWLAHKLGDRPSLSAALLTFATLITLLGPATALGAAFAAQVADLLQYAQQLTADHRPSDLSDLATIPLLGSALQWVQQTFDISLTQVQGWVVSGARNVLQFLASMGGRIFLGAVGTVIGFTLTMFLLFFMIRDGKHMLAVLRALIPASNEDKGRLFRHLAAVTRAMVYGTGVTAITQGALIAVGFAVLGLPSPIVFGVLAALFALIPMAGTPVVWIPAVLVLTAQQRFVAALVLLAWGVFVTLIDNFLRPYLVSGRANVSTLTVFMGVLGGVSAFGPTGVFAGPLVLALVIALIRFTLEIRDAEPEITNVSAVTNPKTSRDETRP